MRLCPSPNWISKDLAKYKSYLLMQTNWALKLYLMSLCTLSLWACQTDQSYVSSSWTLAEHVLDKAFDPESSFELDTYRGSLSKRAQSQIQGFLAAKLSDQTLGLLSIERNQKGTWHAFYAYQRQKWPLLFQLELESRGKTQQKWQISSFPFLSAYQQLAELIPPRDELSYDNTQTKSRHLPQVNQALPWRGGLSGRDDRGRLQSSVVVVWSPPLVFVDGLALSGQVDRKKLSIRVSQAFEKRKNLAHQAQASYTEHVSLALSAGLPASELTKLMAWLEGIGTQQISLLVQSKHGPGLIYLGTRSSTQSLYQPQRLLNVKFPQKQSTQSGPILFVRQSDQKQAERIKSQLVPNSRRWGNELFEFIEHAQSKELLHGVVLHVTEQTLVKDIAMFIDHYRGIDQDLPLTLAPMPTTAR